MRTFAQKPKAAQQTAFAMSMEPNRIRAAQSPHLNSIVRVQRVSETDTQTVGGHPTTTNAARFGHAFSQMRVYEAAPAESKTTANTFRVADLAAGNEKSVEDGEQNYIDDLLVERGPAENGNGGAKPAPPPPPKAKTAGVDSFEVKWSKHAGAGAANAKLRLDYTAKFKKDAAHDPALAEFRQSVMSTWDITAGPHKGRKGTTAPMHDDNYSRADDLAGHSIADVDFYSNDNPGYDDLDKDDVIDYSFTAEQTIIDTSQANKVIAKRGPHTATVKGKHPRTYSGIPTTLS